MNINLDLNAIPRTEAALILRALAGCYDAEEVTIPSDETESLGNKLKRKTEERSEKVNLISATGDKDALNLDSQDRRFSVATDSDFVTGTGKETPAGVITPSLSVGPPANQPLDEIDQEQGVIETAQTTPSVAVGPLDKPGGLPWDERINAGTKTKMGSGPRAGCWKYKPRISDELKTQVEAELRAQLPQAEPAPAATDQIIAPPVNTAGPAPGPGPQEVLHNAQPETIGEIVQHTFNAPGDFPALLKMVTDDVAAKKMPQGVTSNITNDLGCINIMALGQDPTKYQDFADTWSALKSMIALQPALADQCMTDWVNVRAMLQVAVA